jgi:hypothetical protein
LRIICDAYCGFCFRHPEVLGAKRRASKDEWFGPSSFEGHCAATSG